VPSWANSQGLEFALVPHSSFERSSGLFQQPSAALTALRAPASRDPPRPHDGSASQEVGTSLEAVSRDGGAWPRGSDVETSGGTL
jgi:hypothetical protein